MSPDDETRRPDEEGDDVAEPDPPGEHDGPDLPPPATWAGRKWSGLPEDEEAGAEAGEDGADEGSGLTEDFDEVERELRTELDEDQAGEGDEVERLDEHEVGVEDDGDEPEARENQDEAAEEDEAAEADGDAAGSGETIEADTLALGDREEAEEAALAGLRDRAAKQAETPDAGASEPASPEAATEVAEPEPEVEGEKAEGDEEAAEPTAAAAAVAAPEEDQKAPKRRGVWPRFLAASVLIVASMATATAVSILLVLTDLAEGIGGIEDIEQVLEPAEGGDPQTLLILGSDERLGFQAAEGARSDTTILLRVDPDHGVISLLSIPRDLKVDFADLGIDGLGTGKFNEAYSKGGPKLTLRAAKRLTGLEINHVVNINFTGFADAVNAIDCVFIDVDRRYYVPEGSGYAAIDPPIDAGYQRLCGLKALQYVRFRHDDNDLIRAARQQDFLREARQKIPPSKLINERDELIGIFKEYTTSDEVLAQPIQLLELLKTFDSARNAPVNEVHFPGTLGRVFVTANDDDVEATVEEFLGPEGTPGPKVGSSQKGKRSGDRKRGGDREKQGAKREREPEPEPDPKPEAEMIEAAIAEEWVRPLIADATTQSGKRRINFPIFYPSQVPSRTKVDPIAASRAFPIDGPDKAYEGYKIVLGIPGSLGVPTEYWGVSGTNWSDPPILENPSETRKIDGRQYLLFFDSDRLRLVGWKQGGKSYWVNNTLLQSLSEEEMLGTARSMRELDG